MSGKKHIPVIGLTGGAGSGKSYIAGLLEEICKVCHINTDMISRLQMQKGGCVYHKVVEYFGSEFLDAQGEIERKKLGEYIFQRPEELMQLNAMTHPPVKEEVSRLIEEAGRLDLPGKPISYRTTPLFLCSFGLESLEDLPPVADEAETEIKMPSSEIEDQQSLFDNEN